MWGGACSVEFVPQSPTTNYETVPFRDALAPAAVAAGTTYRIVHQLRAPVCPSGLAEPAARRLSRARGDSAGCPSFWTTASRANSPQGWETPKKRANRGDRVYICLHTQAKMEIRVESTLKQVVIRLVIGVMSG